jgi:predicted nuclease of restriction endonuclease-like (RecB) superfamily
LTDLSAKLIARGARKYFLNFQFLTPKTINKKMEQQSVLNYGEAIKTIKSAILQSRYRAAALANREMLSLYFGIGKYISENSRGNFWGTNAIEVISLQLQQELPGLRGFGVSNMKNMRLFYESWCDVLIRHLASDENRQPLAGDLKNTVNQNNTNWQLTTAENRQPLAGDFQLAENANDIIRPLLAGELEINTKLLFDENWQPAAADLDRQYFLQIGFTHHTEIITKVKNTYERLFYIEKCATEFWSKEKLRYNLKSDLYHKQGAMPNNFTQAIANIDFRKAALNAFKDEYLLDFVNIEDPDDEPDERVLETAIVNNIKKFIMALGKDFSFIGNQHRMIIEEKEYFVDLLFFNRQLQSLVAIDLKRGEFKPEYLGKMNFYLSALDDKVRLAHEKASIGIILCKSQKQGIVEYAFRDMSKPMGVATYTLSSELPEQYRDILPDAETLRKLL